MTTANPSFLRVGFDLQSMSLFGVTFDEIKHIVNTSLSTEDNNQLGNNLTVATSPTKLGQPGLQSGPNSPKALTSMPSMGNLLSGANSNNAKAANPGAPTINYFDDNRKEVERPMFPTAQMVRYVAGGCCCVIVDVVVDVIVDDAKAVFNPTNPVARHRNNR